ncbi:MAG TPA: hypothetical protein VF815_26595, partial [Myxococcaceae bacterium]
PPSGAPPRTGLRVLMGVGALVLFGLLAARATQVLGPASPHVPLYNSDRAVPVLMCQADHWSFFDLYYYGQDRFAGWPFFSLRAVSQLFGFHATPQHLHVWLTVWLLGGALVMGALGRGLRVLAAGLYVLILLAQPEVRFILFELAQVYPWQMTALLLAWWSLRQGNSLVIDHAGHPPPRRAAVLFRVRTFLLAFLAIWTNTVSGPLLALLAGAEAVRARLVAPQRFPLRRFLWRWAEGVLLAGAAFALEAILRSRYHRFSKVHFGNRYSTNLGVDWAYLGQNARAVLETVWSSSTFPWLALGTVGAIVAAVFLWRTWRTGAHREQPLLEGAVLLLSTWGLAAAHLPLLILLNHVRLNDYSGRYFLPVFLFGSFSGALAVALGAGLLPGLSRFRSRLLPALGALGIAAGAWALPAPDVNPEFTELQATATRLAQLKPGTPLLGGYWETYVLASLQSEGHLLPVPHEDSYQRTVWWAREMKNRPEVIVEHSDFPAAGLAEAPEPWIFQYQTLLLLEQPRWERGAGRTFSLYRNVNAASQPHTTEPAVSAWNLCQPGSSLTVTFSSPQERAQVMVGLWRSHPPVVLTAQPLVEGSAAPPPAFTLHANDRLHRGLLEAAPGGAPLRGVRITASPVRTGKPTDAVCVVMASYVMDPAVGPSR